MKKRIGLSLLSLLVCIWAKASDTSVKNDAGVEIWYDFDSSTKTASVTYKGSDYWSEIEYTGEVVIPSKVTYEGVEYSVTSIGERAFQYCGGLTSVTIGDGVTSIGDYAFESCSGLTNVTIPNCVTSIGWQAFSRCYKLYEVYNKSDLTITVGSEDNGYVAYYAKNVYTDSEGESILKTVDDYVFYVDGDNIELLAYTGEETSITLPADYEGKSYKIADHAFSYCSGLTSVMIGDRVTSIGESAFQYCGGLTSVTIGDSVTSIGDGAFSFCDGLTSVTIPNSVTSIGASAFESCDGLTNVTIPNSVTSIRDGAFYNCRGLTSITIPNSVTSIGYLAFYNCSGLTSITIPNSVTSIGREAFRDCYGLTNVTIPENVTLIGWQAFSGCYKLYEVYNKSDLTITVGSEDNGYVAYYAKNVYTDSEGESKLKTVDDYVFYVDGDNIELLSYTGDETSITLPADYEGKSYKIADHAFYECYRLTNVTIPNGVTSIGASAFEYCYKLYEVYNKSDLTITVGSEGNGYVAYYAKNVYTDSEGESKLKTVGDYVFYVDGDNIELLSYTGDETSITLPAYYEGKSYKIGFGAFYECYRLTNVTIPESVTSIGVGAFYECYRLTNVTIPNSVTSIGDEAFSYCYALTSVTIGDGVTSIGDYAFYYCSGLTSITCKNTTPPVIYSETFSEVDKSISLYVPAESVEAYKSAAYWKEFTNILPIPADDTPTSDVKSDNITVRPIGNNIVVTGADDYVVYTISGQCLGKASSVERGLYIVVVQGKSHKVIVK